MRPSTSRADKRTDLKRILVFRIGNLGDTLVALPAFAALRAAFPDAKLTLLTNSDRRNPHYIGAQSVLPVDGLFDGHIDYPSDEQTSLMDRIALLIELRKTSFDAVVYMMTRNRTPRQISRDKVFFRMAGIKRVLCADHLLRNRLDFEMPRPLPKVQSESEFLLESLAAEGLTDSQLTPAPMRVFTQKDSTIAENWLRRNCGEAFVGRRLVAVAPGSKWPSKIWDESRFRNVIAKLIKTESIFPVIFGGEEDRAAGSRLISAWGRGANAAGRLNVREAAAALGHCRLYLGNDTGTMHLAAASGTRCVAMFAAVDFDGRWYPMGNGHKVFRESVPCEGCSTPTCHNQGLCLDMISEDSVLEACLSILRN
jgi:ADP-heptose:LPS heptosyltransferase